MPVSHERSHQEPGGPIHLAAYEQSVGKVVGAITGGLIMAVINNGMSLIGAPSERVMLVKGAVLLAAVVYDIWTKRRAGAAAR